METQEIWKDIPGYEGMYQVSNKGRALSLKNNKNTLLNPSLGNNGYYYIYLRKDGVRKTITLHRAIAAAFLGLDLVWKDYKTSICVCHKDDNKKNNNLENLFLGLQKDNMYDMIKKGRGVIGKSGKDCHMFGKTGEKHQMFGKKGKLNARSKTVHQIKDGKIINTFDSTAEAFEKTGVYSTGISRCALLQLKSAGGYQWMYAV